MCVCVCLFSFSLSFHSSYFVIAHAYKCIYGIRRIEWNGTKNNQRSHVIHQNSRQQSDFVLFSLPFSGWMKTMLYHLQILNKLHSYSKQSTAKMNKNSSLSLVCLYPAPALEFCVSSFPCCSTAADVIVCSWLIWACSFLLFMYVRLANRQKS